MTEPSRDQPVGPAFHTLAFATREGAVQAFENLIGLGVSPDDVSLFVHAKAADIFGEGDALDHDIDVGGRIGASVASLAGGAGGALGGVAGSLIGVGVAQASALAAEKHLAAGRAIVSLADTAWTAQISEAARCLPALTGIDNP